MDAKTAFYAFYILIWPALTLGVLVYICRAVWKDAKAAKENKEDLVQPHLVRCTWMMRGLAPAFLSATKQAKSLLGLGGCITTVAEGQAIPNTNIANS